MIRDLDLRSVQKELGRLEEDITSVERDLDAHGDEGDPHGTIPDQSGHSTKYLTTDGKKLSWGTVATGGTTYKKIIYIEDPEATDSFPVLSVSQACTISRITHITDTGTVTWNLEERAEATPGTAGTDVYSSDEVSSTTNSVDTSFNNAGLAAGSWLHYAASAVASTPTKLWIAITFTED